MNQAQLTNVVAAAKAEAANSPRWIRAIERAAQALQIRAPQKYRGLFGAPQIRVRRPTLALHSTMRRSLSASKPTRTSMEERYVNGLSDSSGVELAATSERSRRNSPKPSADDQAKAERRKPTPRLSDTDYLLSLWQSDCAELRQAGVELRLEKAEVDGKPAVILTLLEVSFCQACQTFHGTKGAHTRIR